MVLSPVRLVCALVVVAASPALAQPSLVAHSPTDGVFGEPAGVTQRAPAAPRESETTAVWIKVGPSFSYDAVAVYYTTDGTQPSGFQGAPANPSTQALTSAAGQIAFVRNEPGGSGNDDWWRAELPVDTRVFGTQVRYLVSAYGPGGSEVFAVDASDGDNTFGYDTLLAWPGSGAGTASPGEGYPPLHFWKEEAVAGNNYINTMLDQNGSLYDIYYPSAGAVQGVSTKNEGYSDGGLDQFPLFLSPDERGQMHLNQAFLGIRPTDPTTGQGTTYWLTNANGTDFIEVDQTWEGDTNVIRTSQTLVGDASGLEVTQIDFAPRGIAFPTTSGGQENRGLHLKRVTISNPGPTSVELNVYFFADWALNGGDQFDGTFYDSSRGAMVAFDNTFRSTNAAGEYNPTTFFDYEKNTSVYLAAAMKVNGGPARGSWANTSSDQGLGWIGDKITVPAGGSASFGLYIVGGFDDFANATGTYDAQQAPVLDQLFSGTSLNGLISQTQADWQAWLDKGVSFDSPDPVYDELFKRGLLGTALHLDGANGGIIAGMHNGAYPYVWPRDAAWAAITLARAGHTDDAERIYEFLRDIAFRDVEGWGRKGFWKQKYTTNGFTIWATPQVDETSCFPWGVKYIYDVTGDEQFLFDHYDEVFEAALASSQDSTIDNRLRYEESVDLVFSMNLWEDSFDVFNYSNASVIRGLEDAAAIATILRDSPNAPQPNNYQADIDLFTARANAIRGGLDARLAWNGENTDISQLGITYPFEIYPAGHPRVELIMDRINGVANDAFGNNQPLVNFGGEWDGLINRYWGDSYWNNPALVPNPNGSPWFLTTMWYGAYYALRQDVTPGTGDIDNHKLRIDLLLPERGPMGFGAEQIASNNTLKYPGQTDYRLQTAYPNAWESMSFFVDAIMLFLGFEPDADGTLRIKPKLPSDWPFMEYGNLALRANRIDVLVDRVGDGERHTFTNRTGAAVPFETTLRFTPGEPVADVTVNGVSTTATIDGALGTALVSGQLATGAGATTVVELTTGVPCLADTNGDGLVTPADFNAWILAFNTQAPECDQNGDGLCTPGDFNAWILNFNAGC